MKTILSVLTLVCTIALVSGCKEKTIQGDGNIVRHEIPIEIYNEIKVEGAIDIVYEARPDEAPFLEAEADDNIIPLIDVKVKRNVLIIKAKESINPSRFVIYTHSPSLKYVETKGASKVHLKGSVAGTDFKLDLRGTGDFTADNLVYEIADFKLRGTGSIHLAGQLFDAKYQIDGSGDVSAEDMTVNELYCIIKGNGNMKVSAVDKMEVEIKGRGDVSYRGNPQITKQSIKGTGSVRVLPK